MGLQETFAEKQQWRALQKRAQQLPNDYAIVYHEIQKYYLKVAPVQITSNFDSLSALLDLFEAGSSQSKPVLDVTGKDVAAFADALIENN